MATPASLIEEIYKMIQDRKAELGRLSLVEFDEEEYKSLLSMGREIVREYQRWPAWKQQKARVIFLALACEYVKRRKYIDDNKFWDDFEAELDIGKQHYALISEELLWKTYEEESIEQKWSSGGIRREFVRSLISEFHTSEAKRQEVLDFFLWYYQNHLTAEVTLDLIRSYETESRRQFPLPQKALAALNKDCQILANIITYALEQDLSLALVDFAGYNQQITIALGPQYDLTHTQLIRGKRSLSNLIIHLENHRTPLQFLSALKLQPKAIVQTPKGGLLSSHAALEVWKTRKIPYGLYSLDEVEYQVVPIRWLSLESIAQWPHEKVISLQRSGYIGYKKRIHFSVQIGKKLIDARLCILHNEQCYIWIDTVPYGDPLVIDGNPCRESTGVDWKVSFRLGYDAQLLPRIEIACDSLKAYFPERPRSRISIRSSEDHEQTRFLNLDGVGHFSRDITLPLGNLTVPVTIGLYLDDELLDSKILTPQRAYLFSCQTHECIPAGAKREWGENRYYLFNLLTNDMASQGIDLELLDTRFNPYGIYQIMWEDHSQPFHLRAGDLLWDFLLQRYLFIQIRPHSVEDPIQLERHQVHQFDQSVMSVISNIDLINSSVVCQVFFSGELISETEIYLCLQQFSSNTYRFTSSFLERLNDLAVGRKQYGRYTFFFTEEERLLEVATVALMPIINILSPRLEQLFREDEVLHIEVFSPHLVVWDPANNSVNTSASIQLCPKTTISSISKGIIYLTPTIITTFIVFPTISEAIQLKLCPKLFGFRLYKKVKPASYMQIDTLDYYALEAAALYIFTRERYEITLSVEGVVTWLGKANDDGNAIVQSLEFLKRHCHQEQTVVTVASGGQKGTLVIHWKPLIREMFVEENRVHLDIDGPQNSDVILRMVNVSGQVQNLGIVHCRGMQFKAVLDIPPTEPGWGQCYLMPVYHLADNKEIPSARQWRITASDTVQIPADWLQDGVGISSEDLLQIFHEGKR